MRLVLASASPRRRALLCEARIECEVAPPEVEEDLSCAEAGATATELAVALALRKALDRARCEPGEARVLGADTLVVPECGAPFGKPRDLDEARRMLYALAGREHRVVTGIALVETSTGAARTRVVESFVRLRAPGPELESYLRTGLPLGKAGAYGVQDPGSPVLEVRGSLTNVIGLPMEEVLELLSA